MLVSLLVLANELLLSIVDSLDSERSIHAIARTDLYKHNAMKGENPALRWAAGSAAK